MQELAGSSGCLIYSFGHSNRDCDTVYNCSVLPPIHLFSAAQFPEALFFISHHSLFPSCYPIFLSCSLSEQEGEIGKGSSWHTRPKPRLLYISLPQGINTGPSVSAVPPPQAPRPVHQPPKSVNSRKGSTPSQLTLPHSPTHKPNTFGVENRFAFSACTKLHTTPDQIFYNFFLYVCTFLLFNQSA